MGSHNFKNSMNNHFGESHTRRVRLEFLFVVNHWIFFVWLQNVCHLIAPSKWKLQKIVNRPKNPKYSLYHLLWFRIEKPSQQLLTAWWCNGYLGALYPSHSHLSVIQKETGMLQDVLEIPVTKCYPQDATKTQGVQNELSGTVSDDIHLACSRERIQSRQRLAFYCNH